MPAETTTATTATYLTPYLNAASRHGAGFSALLWATPRTQAVRFEALTRLVGLNGKSLLDVGCGRADLLDYLRARHVRPAHYVGLEGVGKLADAAEAKSHPAALIARADFVREPLRMFVGADVVYFSGSLNTLDPATFYATIRKAYDAAAETLVFNFLSSTELAGVSYLHWHEPSEVWAFAKRLTPDVRRLDDYLDGDCTFALDKPEER
ncbi:MAG: class I SAM-dependent methyltransferase [Tepidisphaeraceae bacterium]